MKQNYKKELDSLVRQNKAAGESCEDEITLLLKELARQMLLWAYEIEKRDIKLELGSSILFDVSFAITGKREELPKIDDIVLSYFDKLLLGAYFNWEKMKTEIIEQGYKLGNPYIAYIELFRRGSCLLKYQYTRLEIYPFKGITVYPKSDFMSDIPFWVESPAN